MTTTSRMRDWRGPAILSFGFRPFFLLAGAWAALAMALWVAMLSGRAPLPTAFDPFTWHAHEFLFGYTGAVLAGFLLTAVPNWTGRLPVTGWPLAGLVALWLAGRAAISVSAFLPALVVAVADLAFPALLGLFLLREIAAGKNWKNLPVFGLLVIFGIANGLFHLQAARDGAGFNGTGLRLGVAGSVMLIALIGGRIVPSFTRNWLAQRPTKALPVAMNRADSVVLGLTGLALVAFVPWPDALPTALLCLVAGIAQLWRLSRWQGMQTLREPLLWALHLGYACIGLGFLTVAAAAVGAMELGGALHLWLAGAVGLMTLAVMTRASLGHTGRALHAGPAVAGLYLSLVIAVLARFGAAINGADWLLHLAATAWIVAFGGFAAIYFPILALPRPDRKKPSRAVTT